MSHYEALILSREKAAVEAVEELKALGFKLDDRGRWIKRTSLSDGAYPIEIEIPKAFPQVLPKIYIDRSTLARRIPHVEANGKICIAREGALLLKTEEPRAILRDAIRMAEETLTKGLAGALDEDLFTEFLAYWNNDAKGGPLIWLPAVPTKAMEVWRAYFKAENSKDYELVIGASDECIKVWAKKLNKKICSTGKAFFLPLQTRIPPPDFGEQLSVQTIMELLSEHCDAGDFDQFIRWLEVETTPCVVLVSSPTTEGGEVLFGFKIQRVQSLYHTRVSLKPKNAAEEINLKPEMDIFKFQVERHDPAFITTRGGAFESLKGKTVAIVGCGSLGSQAAKLLALSGIGKLRLVDHDLLSSGNLHRHLLGANWLGVPKVTGIEKELSIALPALSIETRPTIVETVLANEFNFLKDSDAILIATGDETLDRMLNGLLVEGPPTVFSWIEPLGIGGHAVLTHIPGSKGCFNCLYELIDGASLGNSASFVAHGQEVGRSFAGCSGRFMPFSALDAVRTATEATRLIIEALTEPSPKNMLVSWYGSPEPLKSAGFSLSARAKTFSPGQIIRKSDFNRLDCKVCG